MSKPKQSLAISYDMQKRNKRKKFQQGGDVEQKKLSLYDRAMGKKQLPADKNNSDFVDRDLDPVAAESFSKGARGYSGKDEPRFAEGGEINAKNARRPMPKGGYDDSKMISRNSGNKAPKNDSWSDDITIKQAQKPSVTKLSQPKIVQSDAFSVRNYDQREENNNQGDAFYPESDRAQPRKRYDEYGANRQGPKVSDMENQHSNGREAYQMASEDQYSEDVANDNMKKKQSPLGRYAKGGSVEEGGKVGGAKTSTTGNKTKTGGSNPGGASTGGAGTVTITTRDLGDKGINVSNIGGKTDSKNHGGMDPGDEDDDGQTMMARGGPVMQPKDHGQELEERTDEMDMLQNLAPGEHGEQPQEWRDELNASDQNQNELDMEEQHNSGRRPYAKGGHVQYDKANAIDLIDHNDPNSSYGEYDSDSSLSHEMMNVPEEESLMEHEDSIAAAIMAKKDRMKKILSSGSVDEDAAVKFYEGGQVEGSDESMVDIMSNGAEHPNAYYNRNENEVLKENYDNMEGMSQPMSSNRHSDDIDSDHHDMISKIRSQMNRKRQFKVR